MVELTLGSISSVEMHRLTVLFTTSSNIKWTKLRGKNNAASIESKSKDLNSANHSAMQIQVIDAKREKTCARKAKVILISPVID